MIYLDTGIIIRLIEGEDQVRVPIENRLKEIPDQECTTVTSRLSLLECRCKPVREEQEDLLVLYDAFFASREVVLWEIDAVVVDKATELRGKLGLRTPDAIHVASAVVSGATAFWTTDKALAKCPQMPVEVFEAV